LCETAEVRWSFRVGTIAGIHVELHVTFLLFVGWVAFSQGLLSGNTASAIQAVVVLLLVFACVLLHELGHALAAARYGIKTRDIVLLPIGGVARLQRMPEKPQQEVVVALAGPAVNVLILGLLWPALTILGDPPRWPPPTEPGTLLTVFWVNVMMVVFNMVPAFPMDGGRVLRALLAFRTSFARATRIAAMVGQAFALLFGIVGFFYHPMLMFVALFVFLAAGEEHALVQARASMTGFPVRAAMITEFDTLDVSDPLQRAVDLLMTGSQQDFPVVEGARPVGILSRADLLLALQRQGPATAIGSVVSRDGEAADPYEPLEEAFQRMREKQRQALPVVTQGRLVGLVTTENVTDLLMVQDALRRRAGA
jgi:Zn-dependent protease/CBS domain-containing protein